MNVKKLLVIFLLCVFGVSFSFTVYSLEAENYDEQLQASGVDELWDTLSKDDVELLEKLGINEADFDGVFNVSLRNIADFFFELIRGEYDSAFESLPVLLTIVVALAAIGQFTPDNARMAEILEFAASVSAAVCILAGVSPCITNAVSAIYSSSNFITALIPVLAAVITVSGNPTLALTYNSLSFAAAQFVSHAADSFIRPLVQVVLSLSVISSVSKTVNISKIVDFIRKTAVFLLSFMATVFVTMLTMKGMLAASADNVAVRGIRFLIGNMIPVLGGAVSDAYLSVVGTLNLVKNTVAAFAAAAVAVINLPVLIECVIWVFALNLLAAVGEVFSQNGLSQLFRAVSSALTLLAVVVLFEMLVFLLSVGLVLVIKGSA